MAIPYKEGYAYTDHGFKTMWNRLMNEFIPEGSRSPRWFHAHDLRSMYVTEMLDLGLNPNTHKNEQTMRRVYDRRRVVEVTPLDLKERNERDSANARGLLRPMDPHWDLH